MNRTLILAAILLLAPILQGEDTVVVRRTTGPIFIDGNLDEADWRQAEPVGPFLIHPTRNPETEEITRAWMLWDDTNLYIAFFCQDKHISAERTQRHSDVSLDDCVEAFLSPFPSRPGVYTNIEINALGTYLSRLIMEEPIAAALAAPGLSDRESLRPHWVPPGLQIGRSHAGTMNDDSDEDEWWIIEMSIPFQAFRFLGLETGPEPGDIWRFNLYRLGGRTNPVRRNLFFIPKDISNHSPRHFGRMVFSKECW
jgi:hypothetical protein